MTADAKGLVAFMLADDQQQNVVSYLERGRKLENVTDQYLEEHFIEEVRQWAKTPPPWQPFDALNDIISECFLRGFNLPVEPVRAYFDQINAVVEATPRDEEAGEAFMKEVVTRYEKAKAIEN